MDEDLVIWLKKDVCILGDPISRLGDIFGRVNPVLLDMCLKTDENPKTPHLIILGNPGIGKTFFGYYLLVHLARQGATVIYESENRNRRCLLSPDRLQQAICLILEGFWITSRRFRLCMLPYL
jgi:hypothetical protein